MQPDLHVVTHMGSKVGWPWSWHNTGHSKCASHTLFMFPFYQRPHLVLSVHVRAALKQHLNQLHTLAITNSYMQRSAAQVVFLHMNAEANMLTSIQDRTEEHTAVMSAPILPLPTGLQCRPRCY